MAEDFEELKAEFERGGCGSVGSRLRAAIVMTAVSAIDIRCLLIEVLLWTFADLGLRSFIIALRYLMNPLQKRV
jgi:hypothetical protein